MKQNELAQGVGMLFPVDWRTEGAAKLAQLGAAVQAALGNPGASTRLFMAQAYEAVGGYPLVTPARAAILADIALFHYLDAHPEAALDPATDAVYCSQQTDDPLLAAKAHVVLGNMYSETHNFSGAVSELYKALVLLKSQGDVAREARVWNNLGVAYMNAGQLNGAMAMYERAIALSGENDRAVRQPAYTNIAVVALQTKDIARGIKACNDALAIAGEPGNAVERSQRVQTELTFARLLISVHQLDAAVAHAKAAQRAAEGSGSAHAVSQAALAQALTEIAIGKTDIGTTRLKEAIDQARRHGSPAVFRYALMSGVQGYDLAGEPEVAVLLLTELLELNRRTKGAGLLHHLQRELRDVDLALDARADAALLDQQHALLKGQADPQRARVRFGIYERASVGAELHDDETGYHVYRVGSMSRELAKRFGLPDDMCQVIDYSARLHDLGKITLPEGLLTKPGKFTPGERSIMETHTVEGARLIREGSEGLVSMQIAEEIALGHHEKFDGTGYPQKLKGNHIPISARIVALADVFDALSHARSYKPAWTITDSLSEIAAQRGKHFDPQLTDIFLDMVPQLIREQGDLETYLSAGGRNNPFIRDRDAINRELRGDDGIFDGSF